MARTKYIPQPKPPNPVTSKRPQDTVKCAAWTAVIELGASNGQAMVKKPDGAWEMVRWAQGVGASSVGGAEAIPALTAIQKGGQQPRDIRHGHAAARARKKDPTEWEMFAYPKFVFMDEEATPNIQQQLELQKERAGALGTTPEEVAIGFFRHMISEVVGTKDKTFNVYVNISDRWRNRPVQGLMMSFQKLETNAYFEHVDECLSTLVGRVSSRKGGLSTGEVVVVVDCGHSTMNVGLAEIADGPSYKVHRYEEYAAGAGVINMAVEDEIRTINRANGAKYVDANVWEVSECIDDYFKPEPESKLSARYGFAEGEWDIIMGRAKVTNFTLDRRRCEMICQTLTEAANMAESGFQVLLTGRGSRSPTFQKALKNLLDQDFLLQRSTRMRKLTGGWDARGLIEHLLTLQLSTAVLAGLTHIADDPDILSVKEVPMSLWLRSDPDEPTSDEDWNTVVRICTQGQRIKDTKQVRDRASASHPIHIELVAAGDEPPSLDLSIFGTPTGVSDEEIIQGWNEDKFAYTTVDKVTEFGRFEQDLPFSTVSNKDATCHVYVYLKVSRLSVKLYAAYARDGHEIKLLTKTPFESAFRNGQITEKWAKHNGVEICIKRLQQVARSESLSAHPPKFPSAAQSTQRPEIHERSALSPSNSPAEQDGIMVSDRKRKSKSSLPKLSAQRQKLHNLSSSKRSAPSNGTASVMRDADVAAIGSDFEM